MPETEYICDRCGAPYERMLIDYPMHCSVECAVRAQFMHDAWPSRLASAERGNLPMVTKIQCVDPDQH
jgi:DNA-directed RNA polymerase subunit RPC12/RpoP